MFAHALCLCVFLLPQPCYERVKDWLNDNLVALWIFALCTALTQVSSTVKMKVFFFFHFSSYKLTPWYVQPQRVSASDINTFRTNTTLCTKHKFLWRASCITTEDHIAGLDSALNSLISPPAEWFVMCFYNMRRGKIHHVLKIIECRTLLWCSWLIFFLSLIFDNPTEKNEIR